VELALFPSIVLFAGLPDAPKKQILIIKNIALKLFLNLKFNTLRYYLKIKIYFVSFFMLNA